MKSRKHWFQAGEATNLNLAHIMEVDCTDVEDLTRWDLLIRLLYLLTNTNTKEKKRALMKLSNLRAEMEGREQSMYALQVDYLLINAKRISYRNSSLLMNTKILIKHRRWRQWCLALRKQSSGTLGWPLVIKMFDWSLWQILEWMTIMKGSLKKSWQ